MKKKDKQHKDETQWTLRFFIQSLHLETLPNSFKFNLAITLLLLIALIVAIAEPILAYIDSMATSFFNMLISICSTRDLLNPRIIDSDGTAKLCTIVFAGEAIGCPLIVFALDGFKNMKRKP